MSTALWPRLSSRTTTLRTQTPFANYAPSLLISTSHAHPETTFRQVQPARSNWSGPRGFGSRHYLDDAPFSLWDEEKQDFRYPTNVDSDWLVHKYSATSIGFYWPEIVIKSNSLPNPLPLTIGCVACTFLPPSSFFDVGADDPRPIKFDNDYLNPRALPDPLPFKLQMWKRPNTQELDDIVAALCAICNPKSILILCPYIVVELQRDDGRLYGRFSLPRKVAGFAAIYNHDPAGLFADANLVARERLITPHDPVVDDTNYLTEYDRLNPGVKLEAAPLTNVGRYATVSTATSSGALLRDGHGNQRLTAAKHGFLDSDEVFHPSSTGQRIGVIDERWEALGIALVKLDPSISSSNEIYFEAKAPKRLLREIEVHDGVWCCVDGMSTGAVYLQARGVIMKVPPRPVAPPGQHDVEIPYHKLVVYRGYGALGGAAKEGLCGAPIVIDDDESGGVVGFFQLATPNWAFCPSLDQLIDRGWNVV